MYIFIYIHIYICTYIYVYMCTYLMYIYIHAYTRTHTCTHVCTHAHTLHVICINAASIPVLFYTHCKLLCRFPCFLTTSTTRSSFQKNRDAFCNGKHAILPYNNSF